MTLKRSDHYAVHEKAPGKSFVLNVALMLAEESLTTFGGGKENAEKKKNYGIIVPHRNTHVMSSQYAKSRQATRRTAFKKGIEAGEARKKREETALTIRKEKRLESFQKRRNIALTDMSFASGVCID